MNRVDITASLSSETIIPAEADLSGREVLQAALRQAKIDAADRTEAMVEMKQADIARLELLQLELQPVFDEVPASDEQWDFWISKGMRPRLWLDATAFVMMGRDRRQYRFVRDSRLGRVIMAETTDIKAVAKAVINYIALRMVERERLLAGDLTELSSAIMPDYAVTAKCQGTENPVTEPAINGLQNPRSITFKVKSLWFMLGVVLGCSVLVLIYLSHFGSQLWPV